MRNRTHESARHNHALEIYTALGNKRTYKAVGSQLGVSVRTIRHWAKLHNWQNRIAEQEAAKARRVADETLVSSRTELDRSLKLVRAALMRIARAIAEGKIKIQMGDLDRMIRLENDLLAQHPDHNRPDLAGLSDDELMERLVSLHEEMTPHVEAYQARVAREGKPAGRRVDHGD